MQFISSARPKGDIFIYGGRMKQLINWCLGLMVAALLICMMPFGGIYKAYLDRNKRKEQKRRTKRRVEWMEYLNDKQEYHEEKNK